MVSVLQNCFAVIYFLNTIWWLQLTLSKSEVTNKFISKSEVKGLELLHWDVGG